MPSRGADTLPSLGVFALAWDPQRAERWLSHIRSRLRGVPWIAQMGLLNLLPPPLDIGCPAPP